MFETNQRIRILPGDLQLNRSIALHLALTGFSLVEFLWNGVQNIGRLYLQSMQHAKDSLIQLASFIVRRSIIVSYEFFGHFKYEIFPSARELLAERNQG